MKKIGDDGKISDGHIDVNGYLTCKKTRDKFEMKHMSDYHDYYLKKMYYYYLMFLKSLLTHVRNIMD